MDRDSQEGDGRRSPAAPLSTWEEIDRLAWRAAGFWLPEGRVSLDSHWLWVLLREGWRIVLDEEGVLVAYLPPTVGDRLAALKEIHSGVGYQKRKESVGHE